MFKLQRTEKNQDRSLRLADTIEHIL